MSGFPRTALYSADQPGGLYSVVNVADHPAGIFWVSSVTGSSAGGYSPDAPAATIAQGVALCTASKGDVVYVMPYHNEGFGDAQLTIDKAGIRVVGLGVGAAVPRIDFDHANASIDIAASGCTIKNLRLLPSVTAVLVGIDVNTLVTDTLIEGIEVLPGEDGAGVDEFARTIDVKVGCSRTVVRGLKHRQHASAAGVIAPVSFTGASDDLTVENCDIVAVGAGVLAPISGITTLSTNVRIFGCTLVTDAEPGIELLTGTTGVIRNNTIFSDLATIAAAIVADGCALDRNYYIEVGGESGAVVGTASADD